MFPVCRCLVAEAVNDCCVCSVFNYIPDLHGRETRAVVAKNDLLHERGENFVETPPYLPLEHLFKTARLIADELFSEVSAQVSQQPDTTLYRNNNLKRKRQCKIWRFSWPKPVSLEPLLKITRGTTKTTWSLDRSGRQLSCEPIQAVRVLCKRYSKKWFLSLLDVSRGLFSLVQSALALF